MEELKKSARYALESESRFNEAALKAERGQRESYEQIADTYHALAENLISEMNAEAVSEIRSKRFRALDPKK